MRDWREKARSVTDKAPAVDLDAIEARVRRATEGPWHVATSDGDDASTYVVNRNPAPGEREAGTFQAVTVAVMSHNGDYVISPGRQNSDADFIAHARQDVEDLVRLIRNAGLYNKLLFSGSVERALAAFEEDAKAKGREEGYALAIAHLRERERVEAWNGEQALGTTVLARTGRETAARYLEDQGTGRQESNVE